MRTHNFFSFGVIAALHLVIFTFTGTHVFGESEEPEPWTESSIQLLSQEGFIWLGQGLAQGLGQNSKKTSNTNKENICQLKNISPKTLKSETTGKYYYKSNHLYNFSYKQDTSDHIVTYSTKNISLFFLIDGSDSITRDDFIKIKLWVNGLTQSIYRRAVEEEKSLFVTVVQFSKLYKIEFADVLYDGSRRNETSADLTSWGLILFSLCSFFSALKFFSSLYPAALT